MHCYGESQSFLLEYCNSVAYWWSGQQGTWVCSQGSKYTRQWIETEEIPGIVVLVKDYHLETLSPPSLLLNLLQYRDLMSTHHNWKCVSEGTLWSFTFPPETLHVAELLFQCCIECQQVSPFERNSSGKDFGRSRDTLFNTSPRRWVVQQMIRAG